MSTLADELTEHTDEIVRRWAERWLRQGEPKAEMSEAALRDHLPSQLRLIAEQLRSLADAEEPEHMWLVTERLDPEARLEQDVSIQAVVQEYGVIIDTVRDWLEEHDVEVDFRELSYFHRAIFELTAESVRRYADHQTESVAEDRRRYLAGIAHQMRTPLSALAIQAELLEAGEALDEATVDRLRRNVRRLDRLVGAVMRLQRFAPEELPLHPRPLRLSIFVDEVLQDFAAVADKRGVRLERDVDSSLKATLDEDLCRDAIGNIVDNAVKHTQEGFVRVSARLDGDAVLVEVADSGSGISADRLRTLFRPVAPDHAGGAGLGLTIACHAVVAQGGEIDADSEPGRGSTFRVRLPREVARREGSSSAPG